MIGAQLGHYVVLTRLGSGGMGDVYVAQDTKLNRRVALKIPRQDISVSADRLAMFRREARAAAALNHPNIVHIYSVEEADGIVFLTMELVQGRPLGELLKDGAPLALPRALAFAAQIAEGLASAHATRILHRDLKPGNVMITDDDRAKILDFGVAKFLGPVSRWEQDDVTTPSEISTTGSTFGTIGYMSPEQALGRPLDARTDIFALGVMLFEMTTGRAPFEGETPAIIFDHLLNRLHPSPLTLNPALPRSLGMVIDKSLEKEPDRRYRSAIELLDDLRAIGTHAGSGGGHGAASHGRSPASMGVVPQTGRPSSIVVLPFVDMSPGRNQEYFCHGITEEIISALTRVPGLQVISRTSAFAFQGTNLEITEIGRRLRVQTALEGSVRRAGDRVRVTAQLVSASEGYQLWSKRFDREISDIFAIQDEIAATIVDEFQMGTAAAMPRRSPLGAAAHDAYLKGMYALNKWAEPSMREALAHFREAIAFDPGFAPAYAALAEGYVWLYSGVGILPASEAVPPAREAVQKALELDSTLADAHKVRALVAMNHDWDRQGTEEALARALHLGPGSAAAHLWNAWRLVVLEKSHDEALLELEAAERLNPLDLQVKTQIGYVHHFRRDVDRAIEQFARVLALEPSFAFAHYAMGDACTQKGEYDRAIAEFNQAVALQGRSPNHIAVLGYAYGRSGNAGRAKDHLDELEAGAARGYVSPMWTALVHLGLSDHDRVFQCLERALDERDGSLILIAAAVEFDPVRDDPRFRSLVTRMGLQ